MEKMRVIKSAQSLIHSNKGYTHIYTVVIVIILSLIFAVVFEYTAMYTMVSTVKDNTQMTLDSFCIKKSTDIFNSINNGSDYMLNQNMTNEFMDDLSNEISLKLIDNSSNTWYNLNEEEDIIYKYDKPLIANLDGNTLTLTCSYEIVIPFKIGIFSISDLCVPITLKSCYTVY